jgi:hypothetical protein
MIACLITSDVRLEVCQGPAAAVRSPAAAHWDAELADVNGLRLNTFYASSRRDRTGTYQSSFDVAGWPAARCRLRLGWRERYPGIIPLRSLACHTSAQR